MSYRVLILKLAIQDFDALPKDQQGRIAIRALALGSDPRPKGCKKLKGAWKEHYRVREGDWRVIYQVDDGEKSVTIVRIADRKEVYD